MIVMRKRRFEPLLLAVTAAVIAAPTRATDDVSIQSLQTLVQQQAALIDTMQAKIAALENKVQTLESSVSQLSPAMTSCPDGWTVFQNSCYGVGNEPVTFGDALEVCEVYGASLVEVETSEENEFIKQIGRSHGFLGTWLGATDLLNEGHWAWIKSKRALGSTGVFTDWQPGQPANDGGDEDCATTWRSFDYRWGDLVCSERMSVVCEIKM